MINKKEIKGVCDFSERCIRLVSGHYCRRRNAHKKQLGGAV
jgi:hypothetical protein